MVDPVVDAALRTRFRVLTRLGEGAFGTVYLADTVGGELGRQVAIKVPHAHRMSADLLARLRDEARLGALIRHRAIVRVDDLVEMNGTWAVVMEYVEGCDLAEILHGGPIPPRPALAIAEEVASALHAAYHQAAPDGPPLRLIHRDLKPSNLRVTAAGEVKLLDFGVARANFGAREAAGTGAVLGTSTYLAPERFEGKDTHAGDVYALGVTLFELLTGAPPGKSAFDADRQPPGRKYAAQWSWLGTVHAELPALLGRMLATDPDARPTAREVARAVATLRASLGGVTLEDWAETEVPRRLAADSSAPLASGSMQLERPGSSVATPRRSSRGLVIGAVVGMVGIVSVVALWLARDAAQDRPPAPVTPSPDAVATLLDPAPPSPPPSVDLSPPTDLAPPTEVPPPTAPAPPTEVPPPAEAAPAPAPRAAATPRTGPTSSTPERPKAAARTPSRAPSTGGASEPASGNGRVTLSGDARSATLSPSATLAATRPGTYTAEVTLSDGQVVSVDSFTVAPGSVVSLSCSITYLRCKVSTSP